MGEESKGRAGPGKIRLDTCDPEMQVQYLKRDTVVEFCEVVFLNLFLSLYPRSLFSNFLPNHLPTKKF